MAEFKGSTLFISNLPQNTDTSTLETLFSDFGPLKRCFTVKHKGSAEKCKGFGYVTFSIPSDAEKAIQEGKSYEGRKLNIKYADKKTRNKNGKDENEKKNSDKADPTNKTVFTPEQRKEKKTKKKIFKKKKHRLIVRNLSFKADCEDLKKVFRPKGKILDVIIPKNKDGKKKGFCFVQFDTIASASKAIKELNGSEIKGRQIAIDWAVSKQQFQGTEFGKEGENDAKHENKIDSQDSEDPNEEETVNYSQPLSNSRNPKKKEQKIKATMSANSDDEDAEDMDVSFADNKNDAKQISASENEMDLSEDSSDDDENEAESSQSEATDSESEAESESDLTTGSKEKQKKGEIKAAKQVKTVTKKPKPDDVGEGKTVFMRNLPYEAAEESLEDCFSQWGDVEYVKLVTDKATMHPKGTGFIKFRQVSSKDKCLEDCKKTPLVFDGRTIIVFPAVQSSEVVKLAEKEKEKRKEKESSGQDGGRHLWLARIGVIRQGTAEAQSVSPSDMAKRLKIEGVKRQKLKNPNIFVSPTRLCVHNIPVSCNNKKLKSVFLKAAAKSDSKEGVKITECRIMCDMTRVNAKGQPKSRGYAFVNFTQHQHALAALQNTNNNAEIFGENRKLIVEFSLENRIALAAKEKRLERIQVKQAMLKGESKRSTYTKVLKQKKKLKEELQQTSGADKASLLHPPQKGTRAMPSHLGPKIRHKPRPNSSLSNAKTRKKQNKKAALKSKIADEKVRNSREKEAVKRLKNNKRKTVNNDTFDSLVAKYKAKIMPGGNSTSTTGRAAKWFQ